MFGIKVTGSGRPIIFIPGLSSSGATFDGTVDHLKTSYECHVLTIAGFAGVPASADETDGKMFRAFEDALALYIQEKNLDRPIFLGHSLGGFLAVEFSERYPALSGDLILVDSLPHMSEVMLRGKDGEAVKTAAENIRNRLIEEPQERYEASVRRGTNTRTMVTSDADFARIVDWGLQSDKRVVGEANYELLTSDARPELDRIAARVLVLGTWAGYKSSFGWTPDWIVRKIIQSTFEKQYQGTHHLQIVMADQERHFIMLDNQRWFNQQIDKFFSSGH